MEIITFGIVYSIVGLLFACLCLYVLWNDDDLPENKSDTTLVFIICALLWIILLPLVIYNSIKGGYKNG